LARYAVIGGYRWDRFNVGVTNNIPSAANNPDEIRKEIHGAKYMFGAKRMNFNIMYPRLMIVTAQFHHHYGQEVLSNWNSAEIMLPKSLPIPVIPDIV
jgi:hypothetical protein